MVAVAAVVEAELAVAAVVVVLTVGCPFDFVSAPLEEEELLPAGVRSRCWPLLMHKLQWQQASPEPQQCSILIYSTLHSKG